MCYRPCFALFAMFWNRLCYVLYRVCYVLKQAMLCAIQGSSIMSLPSPGYCLLCSVLLLWSHYLEWIRQTIPGIILSIGALCLRWVISGKSMDHQVIHQSKYENGNDDDKFNFIKKCDWIGFKKSNWMVADLHLLRLLSLVPLPRLLRLQIFTCFSYVICFSYFFCFSSQFTWVYLLQIFTCSCSSSLSPPVSPDLWVISIASPDSIFSHLFISSWPLFEKLKWV